MEQRVIERLQAKSPEEAIIERISRDFNLAPFMARTQFEQMRRYFEEYLDLERDIGQMTFLAVSADTPPGQPITACKRVAITLTLDHQDDVEALREGIATLRQSKIQRLTREAQDQGALLTQEDLARLLCCSRSTIKRDIAQLRREGINVPTRGQIKDIGKEISHKGRIFENWLAGYTFSQIKQRQRHSIRSIDRYCSDFQRASRRRSPRMNAPVQLSLAITQPHRNRYLFSDHYLNEILPHDLRWEAALPQAEDLLAWLRFLHAPAYADLAARIAATDWLIDRIVYALYGPTEEEIGIVEEARG